MKQLAQCKFSLDSRKLLSAQLEALSNGRKNIITSDELVDAYLKAIKKLDLNNDEVSTSFLKELSVLVLDVRFPVSWSASWFEKLLEYHSQFYSRRRKLILITPFSFYKKMCTINSIVIREYPLLVIDAQLWESIFKGISSLKELIPQKIKIIKKYNIFIDSEDIKRISKMKSYEFTFFKKIVETRTEISNSFFSTLLKQDIWSQLISFWHRNIRIRSAHDIFSNLKYISNNSILNICNFDQDLFDFLSKGKNIRHFNEERYFFTKKMAHKFHTLDLVGDIRTTHTQCLIEALIDDEQLKTIFLTNNFGLNGATKLHVDLFRQLVAKLTQWNFISLDVDQQQSILGYISHGYRDIDGFTLKSATLNSITRRSDEYYEEIQARRYRGRAYHRNWKGLNAKDFSCTIDGAEYKIIQLKTQLELDYEGRAQSHCVAGYASYCATGNTSIWSMRDKDNTRMVTIELRGKRIVQIKGKYNREPNSLEKFIINAWKDELK